MPKQFLRTLGAELRNNAMRVIPCTKRVQSRKQKRRVFQALSDVIDDVKTLVKINGLKKRQVYKLWVSVRALCGVKP